MVKANPESQSIAPQDFQPPINIHMSTKSCEGLRTLG